MTEALGGLRVSRHIPAPTLGQHTDALLRHLGYDEATIARYHAEDIV